MLAGNGDAVSAVVNFLVPETELVSRMLGRAKAEGRADDRPETIRERLRVYRDKTDPSSSSIASATCWPTWTAWAPRKRSPRASTAP